MKIDKLVWIIPIIAIFIIISVLIHNKDLDNNIWNIRIYEIWNNPLAGRRQHEQRILHINSDKAIGKVTYLDEKTNLKETKHFKISKSDINKIIELANNGELSNNKKSGETYTMYKIEIDSKISFVDSSLDKENIISKLFID